MSRYGPNKLEERGLRSPPEGAAGTIYRDHDHRDPQRNPWLHAGLLGRMGDGRAQGDVGSEILVLVISIIIL